MSAARAGPAGAADGMTARGQPQSNMGAKWHVELESFDDQRVCARALAHEADGWFDGHFPGMPILPAVGVLALVEQTLRQWGAGPAGEDVSVRGLERVRFRAPISPGTGLVVEICTRFEDLRLVYEFAVRTDGQTVCTGRILA